LARTVGDRLHVALLHIAPRAGDLAFNRRLIESAIVTAAAEGSDWVITPDLAVCGYTFEPLIGTDWIPAQPDPWMTAICNLAARLGIVVFLSVPERDAESNLLYNATFVIDRTGAICGKHRKVNALRVGSEAWSTPGIEISPIAVDGRSVGVMICADAYSPGVAKQLHGRGAQLLVSSAAWRPGCHGPQGEWERATSDTGLPLFVCNRTGLDVALDFSRGESVLAHGGSRLISAASKTSAVLSFTWDFVGSRPEKSIFDKIELE
jgi:predicted amidohydrolase